MISGSVTAAREAVIPLEVRGPLSQAAQITAVIDSGFTGWLTLPPPLVAALALHRVGARRATLADGSDVNMDVYESKVLWDGQPLDILALEADGDPLVGMSLLYGSTLTIQVVDGGDVTIVPLP
jgi:clan AA aspartic protease